jgi:hypothetical protein
VRALQTAKSFRSHVKIAHQQQCSRQADREGDDCQECYPREIGDGLGGGDEGGGGGGDRQVGGGDGNRLEALARLASGDDSGGGEATPTPGVGARGPSQGAGG